VGDGCAVLTENEQVKRAGYRLALHVLAETPDVCPGLGPVLSEITKYELIPEE
jgi:hypothetical protein